MEEDEKEKKRRREGGGEWEGGWCFPRKSLALWATRVVTGSLKKPSEDTTSWLSYCSNLLLLYISGLTHITQPNPPTSEKVKSSHNNKNKNFPQ